MSEQPLEHHVAVTWAAPLLFVSGGCALVFQVVWIRELRLVFGATTASSAAVLSIFMAGLGLGNAFFGRRIDRSTRPWRAYGMMEAGIAISAAASLLLIDAARQVYVGLGGQLTLGSSAAMLVRLSASAAVLAVPTFLMGGTMPAAARAVSIDNDRKRRRVALLYGANTLGAVFGAGLANFYLLEALGNRAALWGACAINLLLAAVVLTVSHRLTLSTIPRQRHPNRRLPRTEATGVAPRKIQLVYAASATVGFVFFLMEIVWYRMLGPLLGGTTYTFGLILCVALTGIGLGGAIYSLLSRRIQPSLSLLGITCAIEALTIAVPFWRGDRIALWVLQQQSETVATFGEQIVNWFEIAAFVVLPPALAAGFQFPLLVAIAGTGKRDVGRHVGLTFAANTLGAICGSLAGGFLLLPLFTAPGLWRLSVCGLVLLAVVVMFVSDRQRLVQTVLAMSILVTALLAVWQQGPTAVWRHAGIGAGRAAVGGSGPNVIQEFINAKRRQCIWEAEGIESSVAITAVDSLAFIVNGKSDGNAIGDAGTQIGLGLIGPLLHQAPKRGLVIGLGTGESAGWMAAVDDVETVEVVELEPALLRMSERCAPVNCDVLNNSKVRVIYNDAREHLLTVPSEYDLIVSEPSNPYRAGIANLYTDAFYKAASERLNRKGLFLQWLQSYEVDDRTVKIVLRTICSHFPNVQIWRTRARDMVIVCGKTEESLKYNLAAIKARLKDSAISTGLNRAWRVEDIDGVLAHYVCGNKTIVKFLKDAEETINTDDRNLLEYAFARTVGRSTRFSLDDLQSLALQISDDSPPTISKVDSDKRDRRRLAMMLYLGGYVLEVDDELSHRQRPRVDAYRAYLAKRYDRAILQFEDLTIDADCPIERTVYSHALAETGRIADDKMFAPLDSDNPTEAAAIRAIAYFKDGNSKVAVEQILLMLQRLQDSPWGSRQILDSALGIAAGMADTDADVAHLIYDEIKQPFAMHRLEEARLMLRFIASEKLEAVETIRSLAVLEPNVPWKGWFLENRVRLYDKQQHPLVEKARRDLKRFRIQTNRSR